MYLLKIQGSGKIPNYLQIRDDQYALLAYFRLDKLEENLQKNHLHGYLDQIQNELNKVDFGVMVYIKIKN